MAKTVSGKRCIKILCRYFGFFVESQKGSHVKLRRQGSGRIVTTVVPMHAELATGTLHGLLKLGEVDEKTFRQYL